MRFQKQRRQLLKSLVAGCASAPLAQFSNLAFAQNNPKLKVLFAVIPDGFAVDAFAGYDDGLWYPKVGGTESSNFAVNELSQYLGEYKNQSLFLRGMILGSGTGGHNAWKHILRDSNASKTSIDLILGDALPGLNPALNRLYSGPHAMVGASWNISYQDNHMLLPEDDPYKLFDKVYGDFEMGSTQSVVNQAHVFDPVKADIDALKSLLGTSEKNKLDLHLDAIEQVSNELKSSYVPVAQCSPQNAQVAASLNIHSADYRDEVTQAHADVIASTLSCGLSRVGTFQIGRSADQVVIKSVSSTRNPHDCAHRYGNVDEWRGSRAWYIKQVKYVLDRLNAFPDPDVPGDSLLDHTLVVLTSEMADGAPEHMQDIPITFIGGASGLLNNGNGNGRYLNIANQGDRSHWKLGQTTDVQRVWSTLAQAVGTSVPYGGDISPISGIFHTI